MKTRIFLGMCALFLPFLSNQSQALPQNKDSSIDSFYTDDVSLSGTNWAVRNKPLTGTMALPSAAKNTLLLHRSSDPDGRPIAVSGTLSLPKGTPPAGGWPIITWTHGTTGIAPVCGPSLDNSNGPEHPYINNIATLLDGLVKAGFAIVATDYQGLGRGDFHPFLQGRPNAHNALDIIRAAKELEPTLGNRFAVMGHSQGGHAALFTAQEAKSHAPELELLGTIAMAPASQIAARLQAVMNSPRPELALPYVLYVLQSYATTFPEIDLTKILTPKAIENLPELKIQCMTHALTTGYFVTAIAKDQFLQSPDLTSFLSVAALNESANLKITTPTFIMQGMSDLTVRPVDTDATARSLCTLGTPLTYNAFPGVDHNGSMVSGANIAVEWMKARFLGQDASSNCSALPKAFP